MLTDELRVLVKLELVLHRGTHDVVQDRQEQTWSKPLLNSGLLGFSVYQEKILKQDNERHLGATVAHVIHKVFAN